MKHGEVLYRQASTFCSVDIRLTKSSVTAGPGLRNLPVDGAMVAYARIRGGRLRPVEAAAEELVEHGQLPGAAHDLGLLAHRLHVVLAAGMAERQVEDRALAQLAQVGDEARVVVGPVVLDVSPLRTSR